MEQIAAHGGKCCGMNHIWGFLRIPNQQEVDLLIGRSNLDMANGRCILREVVLNERQLVSKGSVSLPGDEYPTLKSWGEILEKLGFKLVTSFKNINSGSLVFVFHKVSQRFSPEFEDVDIQTAMNNMSVEVPQTVERVIEQQIVTRTEIPQEILDLRELATRVFNSQRLPAGGIAKQLATNLLDALFDPGVREDLDL